MPCLDRCDYTPCFPFTNGHIQTVFPTLFRPLPAVAPKRRRLVTDDGDFLDLDYHFPREPPGGKRLAVISHGLEGNSRRKNVLGMAAALTAAGWDVLCLNCRGCSEEMNRLPRLYHSGVTDDLHRILRHAVDQDGYRCIVLVGFSMGGNQTLKYLGEAPRKVPSEVKGCAVFSVPIELGDSGACMARGINRFYTRFFLRGLKDKVRRKAQMYPEIYDLDPLPAITTFFQFDDVYTGPVHGFNGADDYYARCSAKRFLESIRIPTLLVQAEDDPFLPPSCYPSATAEASSYLFLETPRHGGHMGFVPPHANRLYWHEYRAVRFFTGFAEKADFGKIT